MSVLVYHDGMTIPDALEEWASGDVQWRNGRYFERTEERAQLVYTDLEDVREAYESDGVEVRDMPHPGKKNEATGRRYVTEKGKAGWHKIKDRKTGQYVEGASKRSAEKAQQEADKLNNATG